MAPQVINFEIAGIQFPPPANWQEFKILARYDKDEVQADLVTDEFRLVNEAATFITSLIDAGRNGTGPGIFHGAPFKFQIQWNGQVLNFNGYIDIAFVQYNHPTDIKVPVSRLDFVEVQGKLQALTFGYLNSLTNPSLPGRITPADYTAVRYVIEKEFNEADFVMLAFASFLMAKELAERARIVSERTTELVAAIGMVPPQPSQIAKVAALLLLDIAYGAAIVLALKKLIEDIIDNTLPPVRTHHGMTLRRMLEKAFAHIGFTFKSPIPELDFVYVPSKPEGSSRVNEGIPNPQDYGYRCWEILETCKLAFNARIRVDEATKTVEMRTINDPFWKQSTSYVMPDHLDEVAEYNTDRIVQTRIVSFAVESGEYWTVRDFKGTAFELTTVAPNPGDPRFSLIKGLDEVRIPWALGSRKDNLTDVEKALLGVTKTMDAVLSVFGASTGLSAKIRNRAGLLRVGTRYHAVPKLILWENGSIPVNHRDRLSAKTLYNKYISQRSLVANDFAEQKRVFTARKRAMTFNSFTEAIKNKFFTTADGKQGEFVSIKWGFNMDFAEVDYLVQEVYTRNLTEVPNEPE